MCTPNWLASPNDVSNYLKKLSGAALRYLSKKEEVATLTG
jgi:hypothetical protein